MKSNEDFATSLARFGKGPDLLEGALAGLSEAQLDAAPDGGGWTIRQIVHHLVDGDDIWKVALKAALGEPAEGFTLDWYQARPQEAWAERWAYARRPPANSLALLRAMRTHVLELLENLPDAAGRSLPFRGSDGKVEHVTVQFIVAMQADHLEHHVRRIRELAG